MEDAAPLPQPELSTDDDPLVREFEELLAGVTRQVTQDAVAPVAQAVQRAAKQTDGSLKEIGRALTELRATLDGLSLQVRQLEQRVGHLSDGVQRLRSQDFPGLVAAVGQLTQDVRQLTHGAAGVVSAQQAVEEKVQLLQGTVHDLGGRVRLNTRWAVAAAIAPLIVAAATGLVWRLVH